MTRLKLPLRLEMKRKAPAVFTNDELKSLKASPTGIFPESLFAGAEFPRRFAQQRNYLIVVEPFGRTAFLIH